MKKSYSTFFILFLAFSFQQANSQTIYKSNIGNGYNYNAGIGRLGTPNIVFDDVNISDTIIPNTDSMVLLNVQVAIVRLPNAPPSTVKFYAARYNPASVGPDSMPAMPPVLIGTVNLSGNPGPRATTLVNLGNPSNTLFTFAANRNNVYPGYTTIYIGLSFSVTTLVGWELSNPDGYNTDSMWIYKPDDAVRPIYTSFFGTAPKATFNLEVYGRRKSKPVPVELTSFEVQKINTNNILTWSTAQESNSAYYTVEHSKDGNNFDSIGLVTAAGNSTSTRNYNYTDQNPPTGINYYRLKMVDLDNTVKYSAIKSVKNEAGNMALKLYPNPAADILYLEMASNKAERATLLVTNVAGQIVLKQNISLKIGNNKVPVKVGNLPGGTYVVKFASGSKNYIQQFNKQ